MEGVTLIGFLDGGLIACWLDGNIMRGGGLGFVANSFVSLAAAFLGGFLFNALGITDGGFMGALVTGTVGAVLLLFIAVTIKRRRDRGVAVPTNFPDERHEDCRGRQARLLQAGWRQGQIGSFGWHRKDFEPSITRKLYSYGALCQKKLWKKTLMPKKPSFLIGSLSLLRFHQIWRPNQSFHPSLCLFPIHLIPRY